ncbi:hypothetical protein PAN31108_01191 [Pandoraea anhela]|uniref:Uncharacterized protein n=2 Tax=Pandoraea anhela TaxID=2508295 RepID=A0A5E4T8G1_9BURK|nr:hypothetical protein PAN31108_01191 [Pandoraea anhela]
MPASAVRGVEVRPKGVSDNALVSGVKKKQGARNIRLSFLMRLVENLNGKNSLLGQRMRAGAQQGVPGALLRKCAPRMNIHIFTIFGIK